MLGIWLPPLDPELELLDEDELVLGDPGLWEPDELGLCELGRDEGELGLDEGELGELLLGDGMLGDEGGGELLLDAQPASARTAAALSIQAIRCVLLLMTSSPSNSAGSVVPPRNGRPARGVRC
ncbi:MAG: hypothetical protein PVH91_00030 [Pseudomonadales bacterium]